ncbi:DUF4760 domain-containing protein [Acinetobacter sp. BSP-28]|uniref:DUF4760 domain-containing protein n=1 Tax=Acinetobacter sp. BSP-28 TaxID=3344661 RepID=UPI00376FFA99
MIKNHHVLPLLKILTSIIVVLIAIVLCLIANPIYVFLKVGTWATSDWFLFIQTLVFALSALIAYSTITSSRTTSRERSTLDTILDDNKDVVLYEAKVALFAFAHSPEKYFEKLEDADSTRKTLAQICEVDDVDLSANEHNIKKKMLLVLNRHEFYAIGINNKLFDEKLFKRMHCSNVLKLWDNVNPAVTQLRAKSKKDTLFKDLESLATRWKAEPLKSEDIK